MKYTLSKIDLILLFIISIICVIIGVIDLFNWNEKIIFLQNIDYSLLAVLLLSTIGIHLVVAHIAQNKFQETSLNESEKIINSIKGVKIHYFENMVELEEYLAKRILEAKKEVCDLTWKQKISIDYSLPPRQKVAKKYDTTISRVSKNVIYREVFVFNDNRRLDKLKKRLSENRAGYSCRYFPDDTTIPRMQFAIIDEHEIIFASSNYSPLCAIQHPSLCAIFKSYYENVWEKATPIKEGNKVYQAVVDELFSK